MRFTSPPDLLLGDLGVHSLDIETVDAQIGG
jgi:hypothetical protein